MSAEDNMNYNQDYNYPPLNRRDLMAYRNLDSRDIPMKKFKQLDTKRDWSLNNYTLDIGGASPTKRCLYIHKPDFTLINEDIEKSSPSCLHRYLDKPDYTLSNKDIEKSSPVGHHCFNTSRHVNPLEPEYPLPTAISPFEEDKPKFLRNTLDVTDIKGAVPKKYIRYSIRDNINVNDIDLENKNKRKLDTSKDYSYLDYRDVYQKKEFSNRRSNPLEPEYTMCFNGGIKYHYGEIEGSKPVVFSRFNNEKTGCNLKTEDIEGAKPGTKTNLQKFKLKFNRPLLYSAEDIVGSQANTRKHGMNTKRCINPLMPEYQFLGRTEEDKTENDRYNNRYHRGNKSAIRPKIVTESPPSLNSPVNQSYQVMRTDNYQIQKAIKNKNSIEKVSEEEFKGLPYDVDE